MTRTFATTDEFFDALLGPAQHAEHMRDYRYALHAEWSKAAQQRVAAETDRIIAEMRAERYSAQHQIAAE